MTANAASIVSDIQKKNRSLVKTALQNYCQLRVATGSIHKSFPKTKKISGRSKAQRSVDDDGDDFFRLRQRHSSRHTIALDILLTVSSEISLYVQVCFQ